jgi:hypothetical protein
MGRVYSTPLYPHCTRFQLSTEQRRVRACLFHPTSHTNYHSYTSRCTALYNAVKKQHGLHVHILNLSLERGPTPIPIIPMPPQLPLAPSPSQTSAHTLYEVPDTSELWMSEADAQATGKFVREFLTQSLLPWMEKSVLEWNEAVSPHLYPYYTSLL